jgi:hypothetical protein
MADTGDSGEARWRVFVSHTSELRDFPPGTSYVAAVERAISACGHVIVDMADFPAADLPAAELCRERVRSCDIYVGVLGTRFGSVVPDMPQVSYTELEFDTATEASLPRLVFMLDTGTALAGIPLSWPIGLEPDGRQEEFRRRVQAGLVTRSFTDPAVLGQLVERSLRELTVRKTRAAGGQLAGGGPGRPLARRLVRVRDLRDPLVAGVHRPLPAGEAEQPLPPFVARDQTPTLVDLLGMSRFILVVGESTAGKTRMAYEAMRARLPGHMFIQPQHAIGMLLG